MAHYTIVQTEVPTWHTTLCCQPAVSLTPDSELQCSDQNDA